MSSGQRVQLPYNSYLTAKELVTCIESSLKTGSSSNRTQDTEGPQSRDCAHMSMDMETLVGVDKSVLRSRVDHAHARHARRGGFASGCPRIQDVPTEVRGQVCRAAPAWQCPLLGGSRECGLAKVDTLEQVLSVLLMEMKALCYL